MNEAIGVKRISLDRVLFNYLVGLLFLLVFNIIINFYVNSNSKLYSFVYATTLIVITVAALIKMISIDRFNTLSPMIFFMITVMMYHGFGTLFYNFSNNQSISWVNKHYFVSIAYLNKVNLLVSVGIVFTVIGILVVLKTKNIKISKNTRNYKIKSVINILLPISIIFRYLIVLPYMLGVAPFTLPGSLLSFGNSIYALIFLLGMEYFNSNKKRYKKTLLFIMVVEILSGFLVTSKMWILMPIFMYYTAKLYVKRDVKILVRALIICLAILYLIAPLILQLRQNQSTPSSTMANTIHSQNDDSIQWWWVRLNYVPTQAFTIYMYDNGEEGNTILKPLTYLFIPRIIYPDKPVNDIAKQFSYLYDGNPNNSESPGVYGEAYWNAGWLGVCTMGLLVGIILGYAHKYSIFHLKNNNWLHLPMIINLYFVIGKNINGYFIDAYIFQLLFAFIQQIIIVYLAKLLYKK